MLPREAIVVSSLGLARFDAPALCSEGYFDLDGLDSSARGGNNQIDSEGARVQHGDW
jgi:hypothetical protein